MELIKPKKLNIWDTIWIISPSNWLYPLFPHRFEKWESMLKKLGFNTRFAKNSKNNLGYVSGTVQERVEDIHEMFLDKNIKAIICSIWWNHSNQLLKHLDFRIIKNNPKIFIWYSDISVLHYAFITQANLQTFYWPCLITQFWEYPNILEYTLSYFKRSIISNKIIWEIQSSKTWTSEILDWTQKDDLKRSRNLLKSSWYEWLRKGESKWKIIGGCIPSINHIIWSKFRYTPKDCIFFLDIPEGDNFWEGLPIHYVDSYLSDLDNFWVFSTIKWLIIWRPYNYTKEQSERLKELILYYTKDYNYPVLYNANIWHSDPIITLPLWVNVSINSFKNSFYIEENWVF